VGRVYLAVQPERRLSPSSRLDSGLSLSRWPLPISAARAATASAVGVGTSPPTASTCSRDVHKVLPDGTLTSRAIRHGGHLPRSPLQRRSTHYTTTRNRLLSRATPEAGQLYLHTHRKYSPQRRRRTVNYTYTRWTGSYQGTPEGR